MCWSIFFWKYEVLSKYLKIVLIIIFWKYEVLSKHNEVLFKFLKIVLINFVLVSYAIRILELSLPKLSCQWKCNWDKTGVINDPFGQTNKLVSSKHCFHMKFVLFCYIDFEKWGHTDNMFKNNDPTVCDCGSAEWIKNTFEMRDERYLSGYYVINMSAIALFTTRCEI